MIRHQDEFMDLKPPLIAITKERLEKQARHRLCAKERSSLPRYGGDEEGADLLWSVSHRNPGAEALSLFPPISPG